MLERGKKMRASQRYERTSNFRITNVQTCRFLREEDNTEWTVRVERLVADMKDTQGGYEYTQGMYKVTAIDLDTRKSWKRAKTFYGEMAWSDSQRLYDDHSQELQRLGTW